MADDNTLEERCVNLQGQIAYLREALLLARGYMPMGNEIYDENLQRDVDFVETAMGNSARAHRMVRMWETLNDIATKDMTLEEAQLRAIAILTEFA